MLLYEKIVVKQLSVFRHTSSMPGFASYFVVATVVTPNFTFHHGYIMPEGFPKLVYYCMRQHHLCSG